MLTASNIAATNQSHQIYASNHVFSFAKPFAYGRKNVILKYEYVQHMYLRQVRYVSCMLPEGVLVTRFIILNPS